MNDNALALLLIAGILYLLPWLLAGARGRRNTGAIFALNLFLGWTVVGWVLALVWALSSDNTSSSTEHKTDWLGRPTTKACPMCAETIQKTAKKCRHCGHQLEAAKA